MEKRANLELMVLIKAADEARYKNMVDILDEMEITGMKRYAIVELSEEDRMVMDGK